MPAASANPNSFDSCTRYVDRKTTNLALPWPGAAAPRGAGAWPLGRNAN